MEVQLFSTKDVEHQTGDLSNQGSIVKRAPTFTEFAYWKELNPYIDFNRAPPSFEVR